MINITDKQIDEGLIKAYKEAGHNAYFGNGFEAGVKFAQAIEKLTKENNELLSNKREMLIAFITWATENRAIEQQNTNIEIVDNYLKS